MTKKRKFFILLLLVLLLAGGGTAFLLLRRKPADSTHSGGATSKNETDRTYIVKRDDLVIGLMLGGYVNASQKHKLSLQANYNTKLLWVIDENSKVKKGELLAKFETDQLTERIEDLEIELDNLKKEMEIAVEAERILLSTNAAELQDAEERLAQAEDALRKYRRFEKKNTLDSIELSISDAETSLRETRTEYAEIRDGEVSASNDQDDETVKREKLEAQQKKIDKAETNLDSAEDKRKVFRRYDHPSKMARLMNALRQAELTMRKVKISTDSKLIQQKKSIENFRRRIRRTSEMLTRYREYLTMMELRAPVDGVVIYGDPDRRWGNIDVKPGIDVGKRQILITIPEMSNLVVDFDLPEQNRSKVKLGDKALIFPDSLPGEKFSASISHISTLPVNLVSWDSSSPKIYRSKLKLDNQSPRLVNGMSVQINIVTKIIPSTIFVPVEAVFDDGERFFVFKNTDAGPIETDVAIGESNERFVQISDGLKEGDEVCLYRPYQKTQDSQ